MDWQELFSQENKESLGNEPYSISFKELVL